MAVANLIRQACKFNSASQDGLRAQAYKHFPCWINEMEHTLSPSGKVRVHANHSYMDSDSVVLCLIYAVFVSFIWVELEAIICWALDLSSPWNKTSLGMWTWHPILLTFLAIFFTLCSFSIYPNESVLNNNSGLSIVKKTCDLKNWLKNLKLKLI